MAAAEVTALETVEVIGARPGLWDTDLSVIRQGVVWDLRLPRVLMAVTCWAGPGVSRAVLQSVLRYPLADPYLLGISAGASTGAVSVVVLGVGIGAAGLTIGAFAGALIAFVLVTGRGAEGGRGLGQARQDPDRRLGQPPCGGRQVHGHDRAQRIWQVDPVALHRADPPPPGRGGADRRR